MPPSHEVVDKFGVNLLVMQEHPENLVAKDLLDWFDLREGRNPKHVLAVESTVGKQGVTMGVELEQATESLHRDDRTGLGIGIRQDLLKVLLEGLLSAPA
ncbi:MAG: hypothetical protein R6U98_11735 [Pirellulaceae bacterium]